MCKHYGARVRFSDKQTFSRVDKVHEPFWLVYCFGFDRLVLCMRMSSIYSSRVCVNNHSPETQTEPKPNEPKACLCLSKAMQSRDRHPPAYSKRRQSKSSTSFTQGFFLGNFSYTQKRECKLYCHEPFSAIQRTENFTSFL